MQRNRLDNDRDALGPVIDTLYRLPTELVIWIAAIALVVLLSWRTAP